MPRRTSTNSSDKDDRSEEGIPTLPILTRAQCRRFIEEQQEIIRQFIRDSYPDQVVYYTIFDTPKIVYGDALEDILGVQYLIYEIIFDQRVRPPLYFIVGTFPKEPLHVFKGSETIYRKAHLNTTRTATRFILTRNLTKPADLQIIQKWKTGKVLARATISQLHRLEKHYQQAENNRANASRNCPRNRDRP
jgi:hypothetical protein